MGSWWEEAKRGDVVSEVGVQSGRRGPNHPGEYLRESTYRFSSGERPMVRDLVRVHILERTEGARIADNAKKAGVRSLVHVVAPSTWQNDIIIRVALICQLL